MSDSVHLPATRSFQLSYLRQKLRTPSVSYEGVALDSVHTGKFVFCMSQRHPNSCILCKRQVFSVSFSRVDRRDLCSNGKLVLNVNFFTTVLNVDWRGNVLSSTFA